MGLIDNIRDLKADKEERKRIREALSPAVP